MLKITALFCIKNRKVLLEKVRDDKVWYLSGGKIESNINPFRLKLPWKN